jgi:hypothetical protein
MIQLIDTNPDLNVLESEYKRLLGFPPDYRLAGRVRELADWARHWFAEHGSPWIYGYEAPLEIVFDGLRLNGIQFAATRLREQLLTAQADRVVLVAVSAGKDCEEKARELWLEGKPDEYFFMEIFGSAAVEQLVTNAGARICAWAEENGMAALPHYSPGYSGWDTSDQNKLFEAIWRKAGGFPAELGVMESGMLRPKKSLLAVFGVTHHVEKVRQFAKLVPCENCSFSPCQYRRAPYGRSLPQLEDVQGLQPNGRNALEKSVTGQWRLDHDAQYSINPRALRKWSQERLNLRILEDQSVEARFRYEGTTCSNLGRPLAYDYFIKLAGPEDGYRIVETACAPAPGDVGHTAMCEYINNGERLVEMLATEKPLTGKPLNDVLTWKRAFSPAGCYCDADSRTHKWGLVLEVIHYALAQREENGAGEDLITLKKVNGLNQEKSGCAAGQMSDVMVLKQYDKSV